jgi:XTP/dITP diphosphohydrolase
MRVALASSNRGKVLELKRLLPEWVEIATADDLGIELPDETGQTFFENALLKARHVASTATVIAIADDSGLEVDALDGEPGVRSARFAGEQATDAENNALLLERLKGVEPSKRSARFRSVVAVVAPDGTELHDEGVIEGEILLQPQGESGFGYDPLFRPQGMKHTFAQMTLDQKNEISHRGIAFRKVAERLVPFLHKCQSIETAGNY